MILSADSKSAEMLNQTAAGSGVALTDRYTRSETSAGESAPGDFLLLDLGTGRYFGVGEVGGFIWQRLDGARDLGRVAGDLCAHFDVDREQAVVDLVEFVGWLRATGLASRVESR